MLINRFYYLRQMISQVFARYDSTDWLSFSLIDDESSRFNADASRHKCPGFDRDGRGGRIDLPEGSARDARGNSAQHARGHSESGAR